jgi:hypothetical protein
MKLASALAMSSFVTGLLLAKVPAIAATLENTAPTFGLNSPVAQSHLKQVKSYENIAFEQNKQLATSLTGVWNCNDGGVYFVRQVGNQIWWYGQSSDGGTTWSNVFQGTLRDNKVIGSWADVPKGGNRGYGEMTLSISGDRIQKVSGGENFGGSQWSR